ncbi:MAG: biotin transporter BioY [Candidatus Firestonebacteria bacterium]|nr:biotin transporter BioY [Candidatus Firestonebacteria bacterium]
MPSLNAFINHSAHALENFASLTTRRILAVSLLTLGTAVGAWLVVPLPGTPVPITLQTFFVLAGAGLLGGRLSLSAQSAYLLLGGVGLPWLAGTAFGGPVLLGATGGYLLGFVLASGLIGRLLQNSSSTLRVFSALILGEAVILTSGALWLSLVMHVSLPQAMALGVLPFLPGDVAKILAAAAAIRWLRPVAQKALTA